MTLLYFWLWSVFMIGLGWGLREAVTTWHRPDPKPNEFVPMNRRQRR